jgi:hypothetical protein
LESVVGKQRFADGDRRLELRRLVLIVCDLVGRLLLLVRLQLKLAVLVLDDLQLADLSEQV